MKYRKKPVVIEALQWTGENVNEVLEFVNRADIRITNHMRDGEMKSEIHIHTLEGPMHASQGDWIIKGVRGEFYPCKPDIFEETYEPAE
jgi:hypothetical protein